MWRVLNKAQTGMGITKDKREMMKAKAEGMYNMYTTTKWPIENGLYIPPGWEGRHEKKGKICYNKGTKTDTEDNLKIGSKFKKSTTPAPKGGQVDGKYVENVPALTDLAKEIAASLLGKTPLNTTERIKTGHPFNERVAGMSLGSRSSYGNAPEAPRLSNASDRSANDNNGWGGPQPDYRLMGDGNGTVVRRRMAQREFSDRRDSPVMVRLLEEIVAAQDNQDD